MTSKSTTLPNNQPPKRKLPLNTNTKSTNNPESSINTNPNLSSNNNEHLFQFQNMKQKQTIIDSPLTENKRYSPFKKKQQQQEEIKEEITETLPTPHNLYSEPSEDRCHVATITSNHNNNNNNNKQSTTQQNNNNKFINPFDSIQSSNNFGLSYSNSNSVNASNLLVNRSTNKFNFNTSMNNNNMFFNKNTNYGTNHNYIPEDDINYKLNNNDEEQDDDDNVGNSNAEIINKFNTINYEVFTNESNFQIKNEKPNEHNLSKNIQINLPNIINYIQQYHIPHCAITPYETKKKIECIINNVLYNDIKVTNFKQIKHKPTHKWLMPSLHEINEQLDKMFYNNLPSMKIFEEHNKLLHQTIIHIKDTYTSYISDLYTYIFTNNLKDDTFTHYRKVVCDDDYAGILRLLIFAYIENCICFNRKESLSITLYNFIMNIPQTECYISNIITVKILLEHLNKNQLDLAYQVLINIFVSNTSFVNDIVDYIAQIFKNIFTESNTDFFFELFNNNTHSLEYISQSTVCLIYVFGILFNTSIHIYQPFINESKVYLMTNITTHMIYLIFDYPVFYIGYPSLLVSLTSYSQKILFSKPDAMAIINTAPMHCNVCNNKTIHLIIQEKTQPICKECFIKVINDVIIKKTNLFCKNLYSFPIYYFSRIYIHNEIVLLNETLFQLNNNITLQDTIRTQIANQNTCVYCSQHFTIQMKCIALYPCGCLYCKECLLNKITSETNNKVLMNHYELTTSKYNFTCNGCNNVLNKAEDYLNILSNILDEHKLQSLQQDALERLINEYNTKCCICGNESNENEIILNSKKHILCNKCKDNIDKKSSQGKNEFKCLFCSNIKHEYNPLLLSISKESIKEVVVDTQNETKRLKKKSDNNCCINF